MVSTMSESLERYFDYLTLERGLASLSLESYRNDIEKFRRYLDEHKLEPENLRQSDLTGFLDSLRKG
ncbi:MAG TPA: site-specific tyrosine recombinase XerD, partial [candidate division Zixibacteria bacterium]|nr:site-specific tyrosine recombinase XerD [candidate division Zixibacteria bacterium]